MFLNGTIPAFFGQGHQTQPQKSNVNIIYLTSFSRTS